MTLLRNIRSSDGRAECGRRTRLHRTDFAADAKRPYPPYYEGKWLAADFERGWIMSITMDENSNYVSMERFLPGYRPHGIIDLKFAHTGDLYVLDYGSTWFAKSVDSALVKIEYTAGNRKPKAAVAASVLGGTPPFSVDFSGAGSADPDGDALKYSWRVSSKTGSPRTFTQANPRVAFTQAGVYAATLTVTDAAGSSDSASIEVIAGNTPPAIGLNVSALNQTFFSPGAPITYALAITDKEDGAIPADRAALSFDFVPSGFDTGALSQGRQAIDSWSRFAVAKAFMAASNCAGCHQRDAQAIGPSFTMLAAKYQPDPPTLTALAKKVIAGGGKVWGDAEMPPHPGMSATAKIVVELLSVSDRRMFAMPLATITPVAQRRLDSWKLVVWRIRIAAQGLPSQTPSVKVLEAARLSASADVQQITSIAVLAPARLTETAVTAMNGGYIEPTISRDQTARSDDDGGGMGAMAIEVRLLAAGQLLADDDRRPAAEAVVRVDRTQDDPIAGTGRERRDVTRSRQRPVCRTCTSLSRMKVLAVSSR
jgi:cytochrome c551/c552